MIREPDPIVLLRSVVDNMPERPTPADWQRLADACERAGMYALGRAVEGDHAAAAREAEERPQRRPRKPRP